MAAVLAEEGPFPRGGRAAQAHADGERGAGDVQRAVGALAGVEVAAVELGDEAVVAAGQRFLEIAALEFLADGDVSDRLEIVSARGVFEVRHVPGGYGRFENVIRWSSGFDRVNRYGRKQQT